MSHTQKQCDACHYADPVCLTPIESTIQNDRGLRNLKRLSLYTISSVTFQILKKQTLKIKHDVEKVYDAFVRRVERAKITKKKAL